MRDDELDTELRRLFADDRLSLPVAPDAEQHIHAGVRRRRRRRGAALAVAGALATIGLVVGGVALSPGMSGTGLDRADPPVDRPSLSTGQSAPAQPSGTSSAQPPRSNTAPPADTPGPGGAEQPVPGGEQPGQPGLPGEPPSSSDPRGVPPPSETASPDPFGPQGYGGMTLGRKERFGAAAPGPCTTRAVSDGVTATYSGSTLVKFTATSGVRTPEGIQIGSSRSDVVAAYGSDTSAPVPGGRTGSTYEFTYTGDSVSSITLQLDNSCG